MLISDIKDMVEAIGLPSTYYSWPENDKARPVPPLPYVVWFIPNTSNFAADDTVYQRISPIVIELYTKTKDFKQEAALEAVLKSYGMVWDSDSQYLNSEHMHLTSYSMEEYING